MENFVLPNKMKCIFLPNKNTKSFLILINIKVGSNNELKTEHGIAHFLEHMMFKTTKSYSSQQLLEKLDYYGTSYNAMTSNEYTLYYIKGSIKQSKVIINIMKEIFFYPRFLDKDIEKERGVIKDEYLIYANDDDSIVSDLTMEHLYGDTPPGRKILGTLASIKSFKRNDFIQFRQKYYRPENTSLVIYGNFNISSMKKYITSNFNKKMTVIPCNIYVHQKPIQTKPKILYKYLKSIQRTYIQIAFHSYPRNSDKTYGLDILSNILTSGMSSILFTRLREKLGYVYGISSHQYGFGQFGAFMIDTSCHNKYTTKVINIILEELNKIKKELVSKTELIAAKNNVTNSILFSTESSDSLARYYSIVSLFYNKIVTHNELNKKYQKVTLSDIKDIANELFVNNNLNIVIYGDTNIDKKMASKFIF